jgi:AraC-like DNA-binding protein
MEPQEPPIAFDLSLVERRERFSFWHDVGSLVHRPVHERYQQPSSLMVRAQLQNMGEIMIGQMTSTPQYFERTATMIRRDHVDSFMLVLMEGGSMQWAGEQHEYQVKAGDLFLLNNHETFRCEWSEHQQLYAVLPRSLLTAPGWSEPHTALLPSGDPRADLLRQHLLSLWQMQSTGLRPPSPQPNLGQSLALGLASLTRIYFCEPGCVQGTDLDHHHHSLIGTIQQWLDSNLHRSDLDAASIAAAFHLSRSTLYELFRPWGGIRTYLQARRLEMAREMLESADSRLSISQLAIQLGFRSVSSFSRAFSDRWGLSPKQARQQAGDQPFPAHLEGDTASAAAAGAADEASLHALKDGAQLYYKAVQRLSRDRGAQSPDAR